MADSYQVLKGKYQMAIVSIRELEQERENLKNQIENEKKGRVQIEKKTKELCETILKKGREKKGEKTWFKLDLPEMVAEAQTSIEDYFPSMEKLYRSYIKKLQDQNSHRTEKIAQMQETMDKMEESHKKELAEQAAYKDDAIRRLKNKLESGLGWDEEADKIAREATGQKQPMEPLDMEPGETDDISFNEEPGDGLGQAVNFSIPPFTSSGDMIVPAKNIPVVKNSEETEQTIKNAINRAADENATTVVQIASLLTDQQKMVIRVMGETGYSGMPDIIAAGERIFTEVTTAKSRLNTGMQTLINKDKWTNGNWPGYIVERHPCPVPGSANFAVYRLSQMGQDLYKYLFRKDAAEPEMDRIQKNHTSIKHGYGIKKTAEMIQESTYAKQADAKVIYMTRTKEYTIKVGEKNSYIPDIVIISKGKNGKEYRDYIEYETGDCKGTDLTAKCNKMATVTYLLNFVVPDQKVKEQLLKELESWKETVSKAGQTFRWGRPVEGRVLTFSELRNQSDVSRFPQIDWTKVIISKSRKKGGQS